MIRYLNLYEDGAVGAVWFNREEANNYISPFSQRIALLVVKPLKDGAEFTELLRKAAQHKMTPEEIEAQRQSWVRGEMALKEMGLD